MAEIEAELIEIPASEILDEIKRGEPVDYDHVRITGDLDIGQIHQYLPKENVKHQYLPKENVKLLLNSPIKVINSKFEGKVDFSNTIFKQQVNFISTQFSSFAIFNGSEFNNVSFNRATFIFAEFGGASFSANASFSGASFSANAFFAGAKFKGADFGCATFSGLTDFAVATFDGDAQFNGATFNGTIHLNEATFDGDASLGGATFDGDAQFNGATFNKNVYFGESSGEFPKTGGSTFIGDAYFSEAKFSGAAHFRKCHFQQNADFSGAEFDGDVLTFREATFISVNSQEEACRRAKNVQAKAGNRDEEEYHFYREMEAKRIQKGIREDSGLGLGYLLLKTETWSFQKYFFHDVLDWFFVQKIFGYGVHPVWLFVWWLGFVVVFAVIYSIKGGIEEPAVRQWYDYFWFSVATAATPGYALYKPVGLFKFIAGIEAILGTFMWAAFITTFARKFSR